MAIRSLARSLAIASIMAAFASIPAGAVSAPPGLNSAQPSASLVEKVHGCHRSAQDGIQGWHRHVGPYCRTVRSGPSQRNPYANCRTKCQYVGPIKQCRRVCGY